MEAASVAAENRERPAEREVETLEARFGAFYPHRRLALEAEHEARVRRGEYPTGTLRFVRPSLIRATLRVSGLYRRGLANAARVALRHNPIALARLPPRFDGLAILPLTAPPAETGRPGIDGVIRVLAGIDYHTGVLGGHRRGRPHGPRDAATAEIG